MEDYYVMRAEKYGVIEKLENSKHVFILTGYIVKNAGRPSLLSWNKNTAPRLSWKRRRHRNSRPSF